MPISLYFTMEAQPSTLVVTVRVGVSMIRSATRHRLDLTNCKHDQNESSTWKAYFIKNDLKMYDQAWFNYIFCIILSIICSCFFMIAVGV